MHTCGREGACAISWIIAALMMLDIPSLRVQQSSISSGGGPWLVTDIPIPASILVCNVLAVLS